MENFSLATWGNPVHTAFVMKKALTYTLLAVVVCGAITPVVHAESAPLSPVLISEIQTGGANDATEEFVELYNPNDEPINVAGWQLQYRPASQTAAQSWPASSIKATIACAAGSSADCTVPIAAHGRFVLVHTIANIAGALPMTGGFSATGGEIRLIQTGVTPIVHDMVGYGSAADFKTAPAPAPPAGQSIKRLVDAEGNLVNTNSNAADFIANCGNPTPGQDDPTTTPFVTGCASPAAVPNEPTPTEPADMPPTEDTAPANPTGEPLAPETPPVYLPVLLTEVFPDPAAPQQDSADEFIELYNPNTTTITLNGYRLQTGSDYRYSYTLGDTPLGPHDYLAIPSAVTHLSLVNSSGSGVRLIDPSGAIAAEVPTYGNAKEGQSWMQDDTGWHWTLTPTPNAENILTLPTPKVVVAAIKKQPAKTTAAKVAAPKITKAPAAKKTTAPSTTTPENTAAAAPQNPSLWVLLPIGALVVGYGIYEYRHTIRRGAQKAWSAIRKPKQLPEED